LLAAALQMPRSKRLLRGQACPLGEDSGDERFGIQEGPPLGIDGADACSGEEDVRKRRPKQKPAERKATRKELRAAAPGGLLIEDVLQRIGFDDGLPDINEFDALVDLVTDAQHKKWCSAFCWTGDCRFGKDCKYLHDCELLKIWRPAAAWTPSRCVGITPMERAGITAVRDDRLGLDAIAFLLYADQVVWGRDLGAANADIWQLFVNGWREHTSLPKPAEAFACEGPKSGGDTEDDQLVGSVVDWAQLPEDAWQRVTLMTSIDNFPRMVIALPFIGWQAAAEMYWPNQGIGTSVAPQLLEGAARSTGSSSVEIVRQVVSLCATSRRAAQLLRWPQSNRPDPGNSRQQDPQGVHSPVWLSPLDGVQQSPAFGAQQSPAFGAVSPSWTPPSWLSAASATEATAASGCMCPALQEWLAMTGDPVSFPTDAAVLPGGLCLDASLVVLLCRGGFFRAVRRNDLKQVCCLCVREASCFTFKGEFLLVGTVAPARLLAYDLSVPKPPRPSHQLRLEGGASIDVACIFFAGPSSVVCGLQLEDRAALHEAAIISWEEDGGFVPLHLLRVEALAQLCDGNFTVLSTSALSVWNLADQAFDPNMRTDLERLTSEDLPMLSTGSSNRFVVVGGASQLAVHDLHGPGTEPWQLKLTEQDPGPCALAPLDRATSAGQPRVEALHWVVTSLHVDGHLLIVIAEPVSDWCNLDEDVEFWSAWHLPTHRQLLHNHPVRGHVSAFSRASSVDGNMADPAATMALAVSQPVGREGRLAHCVILPGSSATKVRTGRSTGFTGPQRHKVSNSDLRARRAGGMRKR